jgi:hypothetical protein
MDRSPLYQLNRVSAKQMLAIEKSSGWLTISFLIASAMAISAAQADPLQDYAHECDLAVGPTVPDFNCDDPDATEVPGNTPTGTRPGNTPTGTRDLPTCDQPNRLNSECDPGSRFHVLVRSDSAYIVAHCRKKGNDTGKYGDIAVIQHNRHNGATCFYQAGPADGMLGQVNAPSKGLGLWRLDASETSHWNSPSYARSQGCGGCHDNGPLIRSPYLNQVKGPNAIPGKDDNSFNKDPLPYSFVGEDFSSWKAFKVEIAHNTCNDCHRMGTNNVSSGGTGRDFGPRATAECSPGSPQTCEREKNFHSAASPIWMTPGQITYSMPNEVAAKAIHDCAVRVGEDPLPNAPECRITQFAGAWVPPPPCPTVSAVNDFGTSTTTVGWLASAGLEHIFVTRQGSGPFSLSSTREFPGTSTSATFPLDQDYAATYSVCFVGARSWRGTQQCCSVPIVAAKHICVEVAKCRINGREVLPTDTDDPRTWCASIGGRVEHRVECATYPGVIIGPR